MRRRRLADQAPDMGIALATDIVQPTPLADELDLLMEAFVALSTDRYQNHMQRELPILFLSGMTSDDELEIDTMSSFSHELT